MALLCQIGTGATARYYAGGTTSYIQGETNADDREYSDGRIVGHGELVQTLGPVLAPQLTFPTYKIDLDVSPDGLTLGDEAILQMGEGDAASAYRTIIEGRLAEIQQLGGQRSRLTIRSKVQEKSGVYSQTTATDLAVLAGAIATAGGFTSSFRAWEQEGDNPDGTIEQVLPVPLGALIARCAFESFYDVAVDGDRLVSVSRYPVAPSALEAFSDPVGQFTVRIDPFHEQTTRLNLRAGSDVRIYDDARSGVPANIERGLDLRFISPDDMNVWADRFFAHFDRPQIYLRGVFEGPLLIGDQRSANFSALQLGGELYEHVDGDRYQIRRARYFPRRNVTEVLALKVVASQTYNRAGLTPANTYMAEETGGGAEVPAEESLTSGVVPAVALTSLSGTRYSAKNATTFDLDDRGAGEFSWSLQLALDAGRTPANLSFSDSEVTAETTLTGTLRTEDLGASTAADDPAADVGLLQGTASLYSGTTQQGDIKFYIVKDTNGIVWTYTAYEGVQGAVSGSATLTTTLALTFQGDTPGRDNEVRYDSSSPSKLEYWDGDSWEDIEATGGGSAFLVSAITEALTSTTIADTDKVVVSDESESGDPNKTITIADLKTVFTPSAATSFLVSAVTAALTSSTVDDADKVVVSDESASGDPNKAITIGELKKLFVAAAMPATQAVFNAAVAAPAIATGQISTSVNGARTNVGADLDDIGDGTFRWRLTLTIGSEAASTDYNFRGAQGGNVKTVTESGTIRSDELAASSPASAPRSGTPQAGELLTSKALSNTFIGAIGNIEAYLVRDSSNVIWSYVRYAATVASSFRDRNETFSFTANLEVDFQDDPATTSLLFGQIRFNGELNNRLEYWDGSAWQPVNPSLSGWQDALDVRIQVSRLVKDFARTGSTTRLTPSELAPSSSAGAILSVNAAGTAFEWTRSLFEWYAAVNSRITSIGLQDRILVGTSTVLNGTRNRYIRFSDLRNALRISFSTITTQRTASHVSDTFRMLISSSAGASSLAYITIAELKKLLSSALDIRSITRFSGTIATTDSLIIEDFSASGNKTRRIEWNELRRQLISTLIDNVGTEQTDTGVHDDDRMILSDESVSGDPTKYITLGNLKKVFGSADDEFLVSAVADALTSSTVADTDKMVVSDESASGDPNKAITIAELKKVFDTSFLLSALTASLTSSTVDDADKLVVSDESAAGDPNKAITIAELKKVFTGTEFLVSGVASALNSASINDSDKMVVSDESASGDPNRSITIAELKKVFGSAGEGGGGGTNIGNAMSFAATGARAIGVEAGKRTLDPTSPVLPQASTTREGTGVAIAYSSANKPSWLGLSYTTRAVSLSANVPASAASGSFQWIATDGLNTVSIDIRVNVQAADPAESYGSTDTANGRTYSWNTTRPGETAFYVVRDSAAPGRWSEYNVGHPFARTLLPYFDLPPVAATRGAPSYPSGVRYRAIGLPAWCTVGGTNGRRLTATTAVPSSGGPFSFDWIGEGRGPTHSGFGIKVRITITLRNES